MKLIQKHKKGGGIYIKPENRGKFNATKERTGKTTEQLTHSKNPLTRKRAIFAQNSKRWKHQNGGNIQAIFDLINKFKCGGKLKPKKKALGGDLRDNEYKDGGQLGKNFLETLHKGVLKGQNGIVAKRDATYIKPQKYITPKTLATTENRIRAEEYAKNSAGTLKNLHKKGAWEKIYDATIGRGKFSSNVNRDVINFLEDIVPGYGDVKAINEAAQQFKLGNKRSGVVGLGLAALGAIPVIGDEGKLAIKKINWEHSVLDGKNAIKEGDKVIYYGKSADDFLSKQSAKKLYTPISEDVVDKMMSNKGVLRSRELSNKTPVFIKRNPNSVFHIEHSNFNPVDIIPGVNLPGRSYGGPRGSNTYDVFDKSSFDLINDPNVNLYEGNRLIPKSELKEYLGIK